MKFVTDMWSVVGVHYRLFPGGAECEITYQDETGFETATAFVSAPEGEIEHYDRHKLAGDALEQAVEVMNSQLSTLQEEIERRDKEFQERYERGDFDTCECGDYRHQHEDGKGKCKMPDDLCHGFEPCLEFRLVTPAFHN